MLAWATSVSRSFTGSSTLPCEHQSSAARTAPAAALFGQLEHDAIEADGIVGGHDPLLLVREDLLEVAAAGGDKGRDGIGGGAAEFAVEARQKALAQRRVRRGPGAILPRAGDPLAAAAGLRRVAQNVLDAEAVQGAPDLGEFRAIRGGARGRSVGGPTGAPTG